MARTKCIDLRRRFRELLSPKRVWNVARETGFVQRAGKINPFTFIWTLALGFGAGSERNVASLRRAYERAARVSLAPSAFYDRFTKSLVTLLRRLIAHVIDQAQVEAAALSGSLASFRDLVIADASVVRLRAKLEKRFPACRTNHTKAALKVHAVMSVIGLSRQSIAITGERTNDRHELRIGPWVRDRLLLFDLGYYGYRLFDRIRRNGGFFISRVKTGANPRIVGQHRRWRGQSVPLIGQRLQDVLGRLQRGILDVEVEVSFQRRAYGGAARRAKTTFRLVGVRDGRTKEYHLYITNVPPRRLSAFEVALVYRARWEIELLFKACKGQFRLDDVPSCRAEVVEALIYAAVLTMLVTRRLEALLRAHARGAARRVTAGRVAAVVRHLASDLLSLVVGSRPARAVAAAVARLIEHESLDPHLARPGLLERASRIAGSPA